ncbi:bifunctional SDR family oxidoreductase/aminotransferase class I/II-fold pyridoxal phosphate-dependent enzyme [Phreatobacter sp.]|uniref:bifunctional SDR family oxidoreductase/aminotransferase class I/II-fold pyridoxal phosphate-dependent enzyme n=1 Tax=Phreatobacter sp. TaxID=1966341 RepID=UPI0022BD4A65|nr:bifunctional SDR family oxidoreductase/aminotransferase class I/II-fold pyridoxal phosphate-dependent enzyme [Phreatobacter sp.]MCZ8316198.1 bifunctional SDR family oxidoreductase/aminotransferase class I/II-fold pyridoxal phosphate-dependent enzyme [Phreatobacter sp.]
MKILLTGHAGYVGTVATAVLTEAGHEVIGLDTGYFVPCHTEGLEPVDPVRTIAKDVRDITAEDLAGFDAVVHLAALSNDPMGDLAPELTAAINRDATIALARIAKAAGVTRFVFASSCSIYGAGNPDLLLDESAPVNPLTAYAASKVESEAGLLALADDSFTPTFMRNATCYGLSPRLRTDLVLNNLVVSALSTGEVKLLSSGLSWRPLLHVRDLARAAAAILAADADTVRGEAFNIGQNSENHLVRDIATIVAEAVPGSRVTFAEGNTIDPRSYRVDFGRFAAAFPDFRFLHTAASGAKELVAALAGRTTADDLSGQRYVRLARLKSLMAAEKLAEDLTWRTARETTPLGVKRERVPVAGPSITQREVDLTAEAARHAWFENHAKYNQRFEAMVAAQTGRKHAISLAHCTSAIHLALVGLGIGPGDEVIVPECTWVATASPVVQIGANPVFVDIDPVSWCMSPASLAAAITPKTKAAIVVDLYGGMPDWARLETIARDAGIILIEDAAEAIGSRFRDKPAGAFGRASVFSFHGSKTVTTGEGGMLVTDDDALAERVNILRDQGRHPTSRALVTEEVGFKYRMSAMQAAMGIAQMERLDELIAMKRDIFRFYAEALDGTPGLTLNAEPPHVFNTYWMVTAVLDPKLGLLKQQVAAELGAEGIDTRPFFYPLSWQPAFRSQPSAAGASARNTNAYGISPTGINLPSGYNVTRDVAARVARGLKSILARHARRVA